MSDSNRSEPVGVGRRIGGAIGGVFDEALGVAVASVSAVGRQVVSSRWLPGYRKDRTLPAGARPGIEHLPEVQEVPEAGAVYVRCIDYGDQDASDLDVVDLDGFLTQAPPEWAKVRWINVDGLHASVVHRLQRYFDYHGLAAEDVLHVPQRPKVEGYGDHLFIVARMFEMRAGQLVSEQVSFFLKPGLLVTFQEARGDVWDPIRARLQNGMGRVRTADASYLAYALLDATVDSCFPIIERYGDILEDLEARLLESPSPELLHDLHGVKRDLTVLRRVLWPTRELVRALMQDETGVISENTKTYLRDVHEHAVQIVELVETFRDMVNSLTDLYMSVLSLRMNEVMKVLTIMATIFIPITFLAGVYGMNFEHMPELSQKWAYPAFWGICAAITLGLLLYFRRKGWIGSP